MKIGLEKEFRAVRDLNPWPLRYRCSALPAELTSQLGAGIWIFGPNILTCWSVFRATDLVCCGSFIICSWLPKFLFFQIEMKNKINFPNYAYFSTENEGEIYWFPGRNVFVSCPLRSGSGQNIEQTERFPFFSFFFLLDKQICESE